MRTRSGTIRRHIFSGALSVIQGAMDQKQSLCIIRVCAEKYPNLMTLVEVRHPYLPGVPC